MAVGCHPSWAAPLVGRELELARLRAALDEAMAGRGGLVLVTGEPGIGKTRLVEELASHAADAGALVVWGRVDDGQGAPPYWPWVQILGGLLASCDRDVLVAALAGTAGVIASIVPEVAALGASDVSAPMLDPAQARFRLHRSVAETLGRVSRHRPLVLVVDDLHWADVASLELMRFVARSLGTDEMAAAFADNLATGARINSSPFRGLLAAGELRRGDRERALAIVDEALRLQGEDRLFEPDLHRRRGEVLAAMGPERRGDAVEALRTAVTLAEARGALRSRRAPRRRWSASPRPAAPRRRRQASAPESASCCASSGAA